VVLLGLALLAALLVAPGAHAEDATRLRIDAAAPLEPVNRDLVGVGWHPEAQPLLPVAALEPRTVRIDASLQEVSPAPGELHLGPLLQQVAEIRAVGGEPLVILSYMPAWLGSPYAFGRDPTRVAPADLDAWQQLVHDVVHALATAPAPAVRFEAWNEPDIPIFWQDTPTAWTTMITRTARAIAQVESETGIDLAFGGPATALPDPVYLAAFLLPLRDRSLPLDFVSWHYYANLPFLGPDGVEFPLLAPVQPILGQRNPLASPGLYGPQVGLMRDLTAVALLGSGRPSPTLIIDEWNLSAAGFDRRHDTNEGAAFAAGTLIEMQQAGLDEAAFFQAGDTASRADPYGGHGLVAPDGTPKPTWWTMWLWQRQASRRVVLDGGHRLEGLWAQAATDGDRITVLLASFSALSPQGRTIELDLSHAPWLASAATVRRIDADHHRADEATPLSVEGELVRVPLPAQAVALVEITRADAPSPG
jgi:hypothetical protein